MRMLLLTFLIPLLAGCTVASRAESPAEMLGLASSRATRILIEGERDESIDDPCHFKLLLENAILKEKLKNCEPPVPDPVTVPVEIDTAPLKVKLVPDERPVGAVGFPRPAVVAFGGG